MSSGWDDLFSLAAGDPGSLSNCRNTENDKDNITKKDERNASTSCPKTKKKEEDYNNLGMSKKYEAESRKKKKRKREKMNRGVDDIIVPKCELKRNNQHDDDYRSGTEIALESRIDVPPISSSFSISAWPQWMKPGCSLIDNRQCKGWKKSCDTSKFVCAVCNLSPLHHEIELNEKAKMNISSSYRKVLNLFLGIRNIRACSSCTVSAVSSSSSSEQDTIENITRTYAHVAVKKAQKLEYLLYDMINIFLSSTSFQTGEAQILENKYNNLLKSTKKWLAEDQPLEKELINVIIACDDMYYRLYYLQMTILLPQITGNVRDSEKDKVYFIPHPAVFFGVPYISWHVEQGYACMRDFIRHYTIEVCDQRTNSREGMRNRNTDDTKELLNVLSNSAKSTKKSQIHHELETAAQYLLLFSKKSDGINSIANDDNVLSFLHNNRMMESLQIFWKSGLYRSNDLMKQNFKLITKGGKYAFISSFTALQQATEEQFYAFHETQAHTILKNWRDSCRDVLCNLYAYATMAPSTLIKIKKFLVKFDLTGGLVEVGAGTGYVAKEFGRAGLRIKAWDISPTSSANNEYHGRTPSYVNVKEGDAKAVSKYISSAKCGGSVRSTALLLCYPPPRSNMAHNAAQTFLGLGGKVIIHIGEFKGLTGSNEFEKLLYSSFYCKARYPCLGWGNDAANVTIWFLKNDSKVVNISKRTEDTSTNILLPCSCCHKKEAVKRCRLSRSIVYCSKECFERHKKIREFQLSFHMVHVFNLKGHEILDFESDNSFVKI